jgi:DNA-binding protein
VLACLTVIKSRQDEDIFVKARGRSISTAVDVVEVLRNRFIPDIRVDDISIGTDEISSPDHRGPSNVSTIEIKLSR